MTFLDTRRIPASANPSLSATLADPSRYREVFAALLGGSGGGAGDLLADFFDRDFETRPVHFQREHEEGNRSRDALFGSVFSRATLLQLVADRGTVDVATNLSAVRYVNGKREGKAFNSPRVDAATLARAFDEGYTVQFFQPQRFSDGLHRINASVEHALYSMAGASAYLTPAGQQGLAPHWDDVDVFVFQTEGTKAWHLWPNHIYPLPETYSHDLPRASLPGPPTTVTLRAGDVLYMPRGTIHEAAAQQAFSTHVTLSVYQR